MRSENKFKKIIKFFLVICIGALISLFFSILYNHFSISDEERKIIEIHERVVIKEQDVSSEKEDILNDNSNLILFIAKAIDGEIFDREKKYKYLNNVKIDLFSDKEGVNPYIKKIKPDHFVVEANYVYTISYCLDEYIYDKDNIFFDQSILNMHPGTSEINIYTCWMKTECSFRKERKDYLCKVTDTKTNQHIVYVFIKEHADLGKNIAFVINPMYKENYTTGDGYTSSIIQ